MDSVVGIDEAVETDGFSFVGIVGFETGQPETFGRTLDNQLLRSGVHGGGDDFLFIHAGISRSKNFAEQNCSEWPQNLTPFLGVRHLEPTATG